jgi:hypothetical protein
MSSHVTLLVGWELKGGGVIEADRIEHTLLTLKNRDKFRLGNAT